ncbi:MAG TPA: flippase [Candidatus Angelobacter sp.]|nr:flippase [Candidatus Angelobacter sp.]
MSLARRTVRNTALLFTARSLSKVLVFATVIVTQNALGATGYGKFAAIVVFSNIASIFADLGLQVVFVREASRRLDDLGAFLGTTLAAKVPLGALSGVILAVSVWLLAPDLLPLVGPVFALLVATSVANLLRSTFYATGEMRYEVVAIAGETVVLLVATVLAAVFKQGVAAFVWAYAASYAFTAVYAAVITQRRYTRLRLVWNSALLRKLLRSGLPFALAFVLSTIYFRIDVVILKSLRGDAQVAYYNAAYKFLDGLSFIPQAAMSAVFPALAVIHLRGRDPMRDAYTRAYRLLAALGMPVAVACVILAPQIIHITHVPFEQSIPALRILGASLLLIFVNNSFIFALGAMDKQLTFALLAGLSIVVNVTLNLVMIPRFAFADGYLAASWATLITEVFLFVAGYIALARYLGRMPWLRPAIPIALSGAVVAAVSYALRNHHVAIVVAVAAVVYVATLAITGGVSRSEWRLARESLRLRRGGAPAP